jgi:hypothetical protein
MRDPPKRKPTPAGTTPKVDLYIEPVIAPQSMFFYKELAPKSSSSKKRFIVEPTK